MIKNNKYFAEPPTGKDIKELFRYAVSSGVGLRVDRQGIPVGSWSSDTLTKALAEMSSDGSVDIRTVQNWFQDNEKCIGSANISLLAKVFGCDSPDGVIAWRRELHEANRLLRLKRRAKNNLDTESDNGLEPPTSVVVQAPTTKAKSYPDISAKPINLAHRIEALFDGSPIKLAAWVFGGAVAIGYTSVALKIHDADISLPDIPSKEIGFLWAVNWMLSFLIFLPLFLINTTSVLRYWKSRGRVGVRGVRINEEQTVSWSDRVAESSSINWVVLIVCLLFAGVMQWVSVRLLPVLNGDLNHSFDWGYLTLVRPDLISPNEQLIFSGVAYLYMCVSFFLMFAGLILLYTISRDFSGCVGELPETITLAHEKEYLLAGKVILVAVFKCVLLAVLIATAMKSQSAYLGSDSSNIAMWLLDDAYSALFSNDALKTHNATSEPNHFSSLVIVLSALFVFIFTAMQIPKAARVEVSFKSMVATVLVLVASYLLIGIFEGFSLLLVIAVFVATIALVRPAQRKFDKWVIRSKNAG